MIDGDAGQRGAGLLGDRDGDHEEGCSDEEPGVLGQKGPQAQLGALLRGGPLAELGGDRAVVGLGREESVDAFLELAGDAPEGQPIDGSAWWADRSPAPGHQSTPRDSPRSICGLTSIGVARAAHPLSRAMPRSWASASRSAPCARTSAYRGVVAKSSS